ncbi:MAG TPA: AzlC family ABC transporter permease [Spirochaetia bacterium]|jgi:4-azaleucine resistance transporter AzlC|nr:AzlC family ABC transporter permease [Spirochaetia bacterium]
MRSHVFRTSLPVAFGYVPLGMAFGVLLVGLGYPWWWAPVMGVLIFAGSAQFLAVSLLASGAGLVDAFVATFLLNLRHVFYGLTVLDRYRALGWPRVYAVFGLTDETFSLVAGAPVHDRDRAFILGLTALNQSWWVLGCALGALVGHSLPFGTEGLAFSLTALFAVLLVEQILRDFRPWPLVGATLAAILCLAFLPGKYFLIASITLAALVLFVLPPPREVR